MYSDLKDIQIDIFKFIKYKIAETGFPPSVREIATGLGIRSTSTVHNHINILASKGYIRKADSKNRAIEILRFEGDYEFLPKKTMDVPIVGRVTAGEPILAIEHIEDTFPIPLEYTEGSDVFILNVSGESMIEAGILDGDQIVVRQQNYAKNGDIVVALLDDSATVKRYFKKDDHIVLKPENTSMEPIIVQDVTILGKVIALYRFNI